MGKSSKLSAPAPGSRRPDTPVGQTKECSVKKEPSTEVQGALLARNRRSPSWQLGGSVYFITFRSVRGALPLEALRQVVQNVLYDHGRRYHLYLGVVMPDHVHLLLQPLEKTRGVWHDIAKIMKGIKGVSARRINQLLGTSGSVWQARSYDHIVRSHRQFAERWNYILWNPVKAGLASRAESYEFLIAPDR